MGRILSHEELVVIEVRVGVPDVDLALDLVGQFLRVRLFTMTLAELVDVPLERCVVVVPPR